jgi:transposase
LVRYTVELPKRGKVALARKLAVVLHRMWVSETDFRYAAAAKEA